MRKKSVWVYELETRRNPTDRKCLKPSSHFDHTPESLAIAITSPRFQPIVSEVEYMIIDELHSMVSTKRGVHLSLTLSLLDSLLKNRAAHRYFRHDGTA